MKLIEKLLFTVVFSGVTLFCDGVAAEEWRLNRSNNLVDSFTQEYGRAQRDKSVEGRPLAVAGVAYREGVGSHANSQAYILLDGKARYIKGLVGVDEMGGDDGSVFFSIVDCDSFETLWESDLLRTDDRAVPFEVPLDGVKKIVLRVSDSGDGNRGDHSDWLDVRIGYQGNKPVLSDDIAEPDPNGKVWELNRESMELFEQEYGKARRDLSVEGRHLSVAGFRYNEGVGTHADGEAYIRLDGRAKIVTGLAGVDDGGDERGSVVFQIVDPGANRILWDSKLMKYGEYAKAFELPLAGVDTILLRVTDAGDGNRADHADWLDVRIEYDGAEPRLVEKGDAGK